MHLHVCEATIATVGSLCAAVLGYSTAILGCEAGLSLELRLLVPICMETHTSSSEYSIGSMLVCQ